MSDPTHQINPISTTLTLVASLLVLGALPVAAGRTDTMLLALVLFALSAAEVVVWRVPFSVRPRLGAVLDEFFYLYYLGQAGAMAYAAWEVAT